MSRMYSHPDLRAFSTVCAATARFELCAEDSCNQNHSLVDAAFLRHLVRASRAKHEDVLVLEYSEESRNTPWTVHFSWTASDGRPILARHQGPSLVLALRSLLFHFAVDSNDNPMATWSATPHPRMMCHAHVDGMCPRGARCNSSHSLFDPGSITTLVAHYGFPGQPFTVSYAPISEETSTREWQMSMTARDTSVGAPKPWRDLRVAHADFHGALRLLQYNVALSAPQLPARNVSTHSVVSSIYPMASASEVSLACPYPKNTRYSPQLCDVVPGDLPWTTWETLYWLAHGRPPRSRQKRLNATYQLSLPPPSPASKPDVWDGLDDSDILAIMPYAGQIAASLAQRAAQRFLDWRARAPAGERELNLAILNGFKQIERFVPHRESPVVPSGSESIGSAVLTGFVAPVLLWFLDKWLLRGAAYALVRLAAWAFFAFVYPPVVPCALVAWATHSTLLASLALCGLHPAASFHVFLNYITGGVVYSLVVALAPLPVAFYMYFAVLRALGQPLYMAVFMRGLQRAA